MDYIILATEADAYLLTESDVEIAASEIFVPLVTADVGGKKKRRKERSFEQERREREALREIIAKAIDPETAEAEQIVVVPQGRNVKVVPSVGRSVTIPVPVLFDVDEVIRSVKAVLIKEGAKRARIKQDADLAQRLEQRKQEMRRVLKRRRDDEYLMLLN